MFLRIVVVRFLGFSNWTSGGQDAFERASDTCTTTSTPRISAANGDHEKPFSYKCAEYRIENNDILWYILIIG